MWFKFSCVMPHSPDFISNAWAAGTGPASPSSPFILKRGGLPTIECIFVSLIQHKNVGYEDLEIWSGF